MFKSVFRTVLWYMYFLNSDFFRRTEMACSHWLIHDTLLAYIFVCPTDEN